MMRRCRAAALAFALAFGWCNGTWAFRPFDGTDAAVTERGRVEIEFGPVEYLREGSSRTLFAPSTVVNYGIAPAWEAVVEGRVAHPLMAGTTETQLLDDGAFFKGVLREGALQDKPGPSVATEFGVLLPEVRGDRGAGASIAAIVSQRLGWATIHLNAAAALTRRQHANLFLGAIVEGPQAWPVRPVAEIFGERELGAASTASLLVGAIWQARENVAVDFGLRGARIDTRTAAEIRAGVTFAFFPR